MRFLSLLVRSLVTGLFHRRARRHVETPDGRRLVPAGRVIVVALVGLFVGALLDANSLVASVGQEQYGTSRSVELALVHPLATVSDWTGLDLPYRWATDLKNVNTPAPPGPGVAVPATTSTSGPAVAPTTRSVLGGPAGGTNEKRSPNGPLSGERGPGAQRGPVSSVTTVPARRVPTPRDPLRVWMAGDSLMGEIAQSYEESTSSINDVSVSNSVQIGTGLARPDVYDWPAAVTREVAEANPDVVVLIFGSNDDQDMMVNGHRVALGTAAWEAEYAQRVNQVMAAVASPNRTVIWLEAPPTVRPKINRTYAVIDQVLTSAAAAHPGVRLVNLAPPLSPNGVFDQYLAGRSGQPVEVRDPDGVHLTLAGAALVTPLIAAIVRQQWHTG